VTAAPAPVPALRSPAGRWIVAATVLGSGAVFLESTVVNVALPALGRDLGLGVEGLQWVVNSFLLTLSALILLGGALGDRYSRRKVFVVGLSGFAAASLLCAFAPSFLVLVACRLLQGAFGALLVPNSLAILDMTFCEEDRGAAIGQWAGWSSISTALGPLLGGWLADALSWRWVFASVAPFAAAAAWLSMRKIPDVDGASRHRSVDYPGAALVTVGLAGVTAALVSGKGSGLTPAILVAGAGGVLALVGFVARERRTPDPLLPLDLFRSRQFTGANLVTLLVYAALGGFFFVLVLELEYGLGYRATEAGAALLPVNVLMLGLSGRVGRVSARIGARLPMTVGALLAAAGFLLLSRISPGAGYVTGVLPGLAVFGVGLAMLVAPLTAAVLGAVPEGQAGVASAVNNAAARLAGLAGTAALPLAAGLTTLSGPGLTAGYARAMRIAAGLCVAGAAVAWLTIRSTAPLAPAVHPSPTMGCAQRRGARAA
jgi:EmrB/QacA subfamily drug resistance transporter